jgi:hypothetical protein
MHVRLPDYPHTGALAEAEDYLAACLTEAGFACSRAVNGLEATCPNLVFGAHLLAEDAARRLPENCILFNSEPLDDPAGWHFASGSYAELLRRLPVWDYSRRNLDFIPHARKAHILFLYHPALVRKVPRRPPSRPLLAFYGAPTAWRREVLAGLARAGVAVESLNGVYGSARDLLLFDSTAVLNLHQARTTKLFEPIRCFYPLTNGIPVISEDSPEDPTIEDVRDSLFVVPQGRVVDGVAELLADPAAFAAATRAKLALFRRKRGVAAVKAAMDRI